MRRTSWIAVGLALAACQCESGPTTPRTAVPRAVAPVQRAGTQIHMRAHLAAAEALQAAIADGRLIDAREQAAWLVGHPMDAPPSWTPYIDQMRFAAMRIEHARDVADAASQIGHLGRACSSCHEAHGARPAFAYEPPPEDDATLDAQMARHQWAAARLWEGLVGPADQLWAEGAHVLATARLDIARSAHEKPNADVIELAERLRDQAREAVTLTQRDARAEWFGAMMGTCASCHSIVRPAPVVSARKE